MDYITLRKINDSKLIFKPMRFITINNNYNYN